MLNIAESKNMPILKFEARTHTSKSKLHVQPYHEQIVYFLYYNILTHKREYVFNKDKDLRCKRADVLFSSQFSSWLRST